MLNLNMLQQLVLYHKYLIHLLKCYIHNEQPLELPDGFSFEKVFDKDNKITYDSIEKSNSIQEKFIDILNIQPIIFIESNRKIEL